MSEQRASRVKEIQCLEVTLASMQLQYTGAISFFNSAALMQDGKMMANHRANINAVIDEILDLNARIFALTGQMSTGT